MRMIALRIPNETKKEMDKIKINWSDYLRSAIKDAVESKKKQALFKKLHYLMQKQKLQASGTAVSIIRHIRDHG